jgi:ATP-dependent DNA ligase
VLPAPMLARSGRLPLESGCTYELKWDGFRALVRSGSEFRVRSRRGWNMTDLLAELAALPVNAVLDGELVALGVSRAANRSPPRITRLRQGATPHFSSARAGWPDFNSWKETS